MKPGLDIKNGNTRTKPRSGGALAVGAGIFLSRIMGLVRERVFAHFLGSSDAAGAFRAALKIPNLLQNLFGEGSLSASFIPVYARLLAEGKDKEASKMAGAVFSLLLLLVSVLAVAGVLAAESIVSILVPGFSGPVREITVKLIRIMFPGMAFLVLSAWCLGILNSHRRFFLSYVAPVIWNATIIVSLMVFGMNQILDHLGQMQLAEKVAWGVTVGSVLQFLIQLPAVLRLNHGILISWPGRSKAVSQVLINALPTIATRGVVQISAFIDQILSSFLGAQMVAVMAYAQTVYLLPVSLFGMSISAAELPELSGVGIRDQKSRDVVRERLRLALDRLSFFIIPSAVAILAIGDSISQTLFVTGSFTADDTKLVWPVMAVMALGLFATTRARLFTSAFWAMGDTRTPAFIALMRVTVSATAGLFIIFYLKDQFAWRPETAAAALAGATVCGGLIEIYLVRRILVKKIGPLKSNSRQDLKVLSVAVFAGLLARGSSYIPVGYPLAQGLLALAAFGATYLLGTYLLRISEVQSIWNKMRRLWNRS